MGISAHYILGDCPPRHKPIIHASTAHRSVDPTRKLYVGAASEKSAPAETTSILARQLPKLELSITHTAHGPLREGPCKG